MDQHSKPVRDLINVEHGVNYEEDGFSGGGINIKLGGSSYHESPHTSRMRREDLRRRQIEERASIGSQYWNESQLLNSTGE